MKSAGLSTYVRFVCYVWAGCFALSGSGCSGHNAEFDARIDDQRSDAGAAPNGSSAFLRGAAPASPSGPVVSTDHGRVQGLDLGLSAAFQGIPFAAPPTGARRYSAPQDSLPWSDVRPATAYQRACTQVVKGSLVGGEDCLYLNVWATKAAMRAPASAARPVMVFIYGGGFAGGEADQAASIVSGGMYNGQALAELGDVVVVTFNYRVGVLGFLAHPALSAANGGHSGNYGALDQIAALTWVQHNIAAFGGTPANVTIFGQSAGGVSVTALLASPKAKGLFAKAIVESGGSWFTSLADEEQRGSALMTPDGPLCGSGQYPTLEAQRTCLMTAQSAELAAATVPRTSTEAAPVAGATMPYNINVDGDFLLEFPLAAIADGAYNAVPVILGNTVHENPTVANLSLSSAQFDQTVAAYGGDAMVTLAHTLYPFPSPKYPLPGSAYGAFGTDVRLDCTTRRLARALVAAPNAQPVYRYEFAATLPGIARIASSMHTVELFYVFQDLRRLPIVTPSADQLALQGTMGRAWTGFARTGKIIPELAPLWVPYDLADESYVVLDDVLGSGQHYHDAACDSLDQVYSPYYTTGLMP